MLKLSLTRLILQHGAHILITELHHRAEGGLAWLKLHGMMEQQERQELRREAKNRPEARGDTRKLALYPVVLSGSCVT